MTNMDANVCNDQPRNGREAAQPYEKPSVKKVNLAVEETLSSGCKLDGAPCVPPPPGVPQEEAGS